MARLSPGLRKRARVLRSEPTEAEKRLWRLLRRDALGGFRFRRQHPVAPYILDFACVAARLVVEADGGQHCGSLHDRERDAFLE
ncbi:putative restriction endonuclease-like protein [Paramagnetospirillum caucaseum]|uniref:Putative restriction endonuclease-like protein n=1 Tax=Paramagnetospirillum caucaseum TaxID=1244869 RepID=M2Y9W7_9PROT|nr:putative restriction endonuclease-like protein [Paramagnetospirillum caucaseum]